MGAEGEAKQVTRARDRDDHGWGVAHGGGAGAGHRLVNSLIMAGRDRGKFAGDEGTSFVTGITLVF